MRIPFILFVGALVLGGCSHAHHPTEEATQNWNEARAGVLTGLARDQYQAGNFDNCRQTITQALKLTPKSVPLHVLSAKLAIEQGQLELADQELAAARELAPADTEALYLSGVVNQRWQKPQAACTFYAQAAEKAPGELTYLMAESEMLVAMDRTTEALTLLQAKVVFFEHSATIRDAVGQMLVQTGRYPEAITMFRQASILAENDDTIRERLALALFANKEYHDAGEILTRLVEQEKFQHRADLYSVLGECQIETAQLREARFSFEMACRLDASAAGAWRGLGRAALELNDFRRAELALKKSVALDASCNETYLLLGYLHVRQNHLPEALTAFQKASLLDRRDTVSLCMVGYSLEKMGKPQAAMQCYARALKMKPGDDMAAQLMAGVDLR